jgi:four helix bundle protein
MAQRFQELIVWQKAVDLATSVYRLTQQFPPSELYGLTGQLRRAAVSVASNVAEGRGRLTDGEFRNFLGVAQGSTYEVQTQLVIARRLNFGSPQEITACESLSEEISKMLNAFIATLPRKG